LEVEEEGSKLQEGNMKIELENRIGRQIGKESYPALNTKKDLDFEIFHLNYACF